MGGTRPRWGLYLANFGEYADPGWLVEMAQLAQRCGWEGFFLYDHLVIDSAGLDAEGNRLPPVLEPTADPWTTLGAVAGVTKELVLGVLIAAPARRHLGVLAQQAATLHRLARQGFVLGLGAGDETDYEAFATDVDEFGRAAHVELALEVLPRLWSGVEVSDDFAHDVEGRRAHLRLKQARVGPILDTGGPEIWVGGRYRNRKAMARSAAADGIFPIANRWSPALPLTADAFREMYEAATTSRHPDASTLQAASTGMTAPGDHRLPDTFDGTGLTWWLELFTPSHRSREIVRERIESGP